MRSTVGTALACAAVASIGLAGCGAKSSATGGGQPGGPTQAVSSTPSSAVSSGSPAGTPTPTFKAVNAGNCTLYPKSAAIGLLGAVNLANNALDIGTDGGSKIDTCAYLDLKGMQDLQGVSYAVVRYDSAATAFSEAKKVQVEMLGSAALNDWPVQTLTTPVPGAGQVLGGYGSKSEDGLTATIAVVGTNVGPYLVAALGASTESADNAKRIAVTAFQALASTVS